MRTGLLYTRASCFRAVQRTMSGSHRTFRNRSRVGSGCAANGGLIDIDDLVELFHPFDPVIIPRLGMRAVQLARQSAVENIHHQGGFARTGDAGDADQFSQWNIHIQILKIVGSGANDGQVFSVPDAAFLRHGDLIRPER